MVSIQHGDPPKVKFAELRNYIKQLKELEIYEKQDRKFMLNFNDKTALEKAINQSEKIYQQLHWYHGICAEKNILTRRFGLTTLGGFGIGTAGVYSLLILGTPIFVVPTVIGGVAFVIGGMFTTSLQSLGKKNFQYPKEHIELRDYYKMKIEDYDYLHKGGKQ